MPSWIIAAALLSVLATMWLAWLLWRLNAGPQPKRGRADGGATPVIADAGGGKSRHDADSSDGGADGGSGGGD